MREAIKEAIKKPKFYAIIIFGLLVPLISLIQAYSGITNLPGSISHNQSMESTIEHFNNISERNLSGNDYALISLLNAENANQATMTNKQVMKTSIIQIGFAVISIGLMLILLGINEGGVSGSGTVGTIGLDIKTGSTGVAVFLIGSLMATAGGILKNEYSTVPIPQYIHETNQKFPNIQIREILEACSKNPSYDNYRSCIAHGVKTQ